jgi:hypothetical protein
MLYVVMYICCMLSCIYVVCCHLYMLYVVIYGIVCCHVWYSMLSYTGGIVPCIFCHSFLNFVTHFFVPLSAYRYASNSNDRVRVVRHTGMPALADATVETSPENEW